MNHDISNGHEHALAMFRMVCLALSFSTLCAAKVNLAELEHISDELPERDCFRLLLALNDSRWGMNRTQINQVIKWSLEFCILRY